MNTTSWQVLLVEDEFDTVQLVTKILGFHGIEVIVASNGREGIEILRQIEPTLIITDLAMPYMNGWEVLQVVRSSSRTRHIPIVAITAYDSTIVETEAGKRGFDAYFPKPLKTRTFVDDLIKVVPTLGVLE